MSKLTKIVAVGLASCLGTVGCTPKARGPIVVFGIDGATWNVIRPLARSGRLPTLARLMRSGAWADLETLKPTLSPAIWTTMATGYLPERHGIHSFVVEAADGGGTTLVGTAERREPAVWNLASDAGLTVGVVNWWATFPAEQVLGFVVSDRANLHRRFGYQRILGLSDPRLESVGNGETWPPELLGRILGKLGDEEEIPPAARRLLLDPLPSAERQEFERQKVIQRDNNLSVLRSVILQDEAAHMAAEVALREGPAPDLLLVYFSGVDAVEHQFWAYYEPQRFNEPPPSADIAALRHVVPGYYEFIDQTLAALIRSLPENSLFVVVSDHGQGPNPNYLPDAPAGDYGHRTSGTHENAPPGILLISGEGVRAGKLQRAHVLDLTPTLLALLGIPATTDMPGQVLSEAFSDDLRATFNLERIGRHSSAAKRPITAPKADIDPEILEKLRALGYIR